MPQTPLTLIALIGILIGAEVRAQGADPLPSWRGGKTKNAIVKFVTAVTTEGDAQYVPVPQRVVTFDNDGTLWCEQPVVQVGFVLYQVRRLAKTNPLLLTKKPFRDALSSEKTKFTSISAFFTLSAAMYAEVSEQEYRRDVKEFFAKAEHPTLKVPYEKVVYRPMIELLAYLRANNFKTYICSGGGVDFMRVVSSKLYGIPSHQVIGTSMRKTLKRVNGRWELVRTGRLRSVNDKGAKAVNIDLQIGQRPLIAVGNVRNGGDIGMLRYSHGRRGPSLQLLIHHDDDQREYAYGEQGDVSLKAAKADGWSVVSMKNDWKTVFFAPPGKPAPKPNR